MYVNNNNTLSFPDIQSSIDKMIDNQSRKVPDFSKPYGRIYSFLYYSTLLERLWWVGALPLLLPEFPSFGFPGAAAESTPSVRTELSEFDALPLCAQKQKPHFLSQSPSVSTCNIGLFTSAHDSLPAIVQMKKITKKMLRQGLSLMAIDAVDTIIDQFIDPDFMTDDSKSKAAHYSDLSTTEKTELHQKIVHSILNPSYTTDQKTGKPTGIKQDPLLESEKAAKNFKKAYYKIVDIAKSGKKLTLKKLNAVYRILIPEPDKLHPYVRTDRLHKEGFYYMDHLDLNQIMDNLLTFIHADIPGMNFNIREAILSGVFLTAHPYTDGNGRTSMLLAAYHAIVRDSIPSIYDFQGRPGLVLHGVFTSLHQSWVNHLNGVIKKTAQSKSELVELREPILFSRGILSQLNKKALQQLSWRLYNNQPRNFFELQDWTKQQIVSNIKHNREAALKAVDKTDNESNLKF